MRIISKKRLRDFWEANPEAESPLKAWYIVGSRTEWRNFGQIRETYRHADLVAPFIVFNIGGNKFRLIVHIHFNRSRIYIHRVLTHADYDQGDWKNG